MTNETKTSRTRSAAGLRRRALLTGDATLLTAGAAAVRTQATSVAAAKASGGPDAELIAHCDRLVEIDREECVIFAAIGDDAYFSDPVIDTLAAERFEIQGRIFVLDLPSTPAGVAAAARAAFTGLTKGPDDRPPVHDLSDWLRLAVFGYFAERSMTGSEPGDGAGLEF